jgi:integrase
MPFTIDEQKILIENMSDHWKPYFQFAFCSGLRQGEQIGLKPDDIDLEKQILHIRRAITKDENGKTMEGLTKNKYSRRSIEMTPVMYAALKAQKAIHEKIKSEYFFCSPEGNMVHPPNLRRRAWIPALEKAKLQYREMKQTRHTFATIAMSCGESPLWIAKVMGHRDTNMIIKVYSKYVKNASGLKDGTLINSAYQSEVGKAE